MEKCGGQHDMSRPLLCINTGPLSELLSILNFCQGSCGASERTLSKDHVPQNTVQRADMTVHLVTWTVHGGEEGL